MLLGGERKGQVEGKGDPGVHMRIPGVVRADRGWRGIVPQEDAGQTTVWPQVDPSVSSRDAASSARERLALALPRASKNTRAGPPPRQETALPRSSLLLIALGSECYEPLV